MVTGGCGFIGSNFIIDWLSNNNEMIVNIDKLTYAGNTNNLLKVQDSNNYSFYKTDICDKKLVSDILHKYSPRYIINFAAESHVDRSIQNPDAFIQTNILGTFNLLDVTKTYWNNLNEEKKSTFRFMHISTDEVYGALKIDAPSFTEQHCYSPNSPYSASKASSDHLVRSYFKTYNLPIIISNCSNNYGPFQFPEKLIPLTIYNALNGKNIPIYGDGMQIRDWLYVGDHSRAIELALKYGSIGETYNVGGMNERNNLEVVNIVCLLLDKLKPKKDKSPYKSQIKFVADRAGHDKRYSIDASKISDSLNWHPQESFETGIEKTVQWYLDNLDWMSEISNGDYHSRVPS